MFTLYSGPVKSAKIALTTTAKISLDQKLIKNKSLTATSSESGQKLAKNCAKSGKMELQEELQVETSTLR